MAHTREAIWHKRKRQSCHSRWPTECCHNVSPFICLVITELQTASKKHTVVSSSRLGDTTVRSFACRSAESLGSHAACEIPPDCLAALTHKLWSDAVMQICFVSGPGICYQLHPNLESQSMFDVWQNHVHSQLYEHVWICSSSLLSVTSWILHRRHTKTVHTIGGLHREWNGRNVFWTALKMEYI